MEMIGTADSPPNLYQPDLKKLFAGTLAYLEEKGMNVALPQARQYAPDRVREGNRLLNRYDELASRAFAGGVPAYDPDQESPASVLLSFLCHWLDLIEDMRPLAGRVS